MDRNLLQNLGKWGVAHGVDFSKIDLRGDRTLRFKMVASKKIEEEDILLRVPNELIIDPAKIQKSPIGPVLASHRADNSTLITAFLIYEKFVNPNSLWKEYLATLPEEFEPPIFWNQEELDLLKGTYLLDRIAEDAVSVIKRYRTSIEPLTQTSPELFPPEVFTFKRFQWGWGALMTRQFRVPDEKGYDVVGIVPIADFANSSPTPKATFGFNSDLSFVLKAIEPITQLEQITVDYGSERGNLHLFMTYGFMNSMNEIPSRMGIKLSWKPNDKYLDYKQKAVKHFRGNPFKYPLNEIDYHLTESSISSPTLAFFRLKHYQPTQEELQNEVFPDFFKRISQENERLVYKDLGRILQKSLDRLPYIRESSSLSPKEVMANRVIKEEKVLLDSLIDVVMRLAKKEEPPPPEEEEEEL